MSGARTKTSGRPRGHNLTYQSLDLLNELWHLVLKVNNGIDRVEIKLEPVRDGEEME